MSRSRLRGASRPNVRFDRTPVILPEPRADFVLVLQTLTQDHQPGNTRWQPTIRTMTWDGAPVRGTARHAKGASELFSQYEKGPFVVAVCVEPPSERLEIDVRRPSAHHRLSVQQLHRWINSADASPAETLNKVNDLFLAHTLRQAGE